MQIDWPAERGFVWFISHAGYMIIDIRVLVNLRILALLERCNGWNPVKHIESGCGWRYVIIGFAENFKMSVHDGGDRTNISYFK